MAVTNVQLAVPIVGLKLTQHWGQATAVITCKCKDGNPPMVIRGVDLIEQCRACGQCYGIVKVEYERDLRNPHVPCKVWVAPLSFGPKGVPQ